MSGTSLFLKWFLGAVRVFVGTAAQDWDLGRGGTGAIYSSSHRARDLDGRTQCGPCYRCCAHADSREDSHAGAGPSRCAEQVGRLQHSLRVLTGLHAQRRHAGCTVALTTIGGQEGQAHGVRNAAGAQTITWKITKAGPIMRMLNRFPSSRHLHLLLTQSNKNHFYLSVWRPVRGPERRWQSWGGSLVCKTGRRGRWDPLSCWCWWHKVSDYLTEQAN